MGFELPQGIVFQVTAEEIVVISEKPDRGEYLKTLPIPRSERSEMDRCSAEFPDGPTTGSVR